MKTRLEELNYPFGWLDEVTEVTLNPSKGKVAELQVDVLTRLQEQFETEVRQVLRHLKTQTFFLLSSDKKKLVVQQYTTAISLLKQQSQYNLDNYPENPVLRDAGTAIINYLDELSKAIEKRYFCYLPGPLPPATNPAIPTPGSFKILLDLSVDQIGIILKAADDTKMIISRSIRQVFKTIVPFLSTPNKSDLSWESVRSNSYYPEEKDKDVAIAALEKLIRQIRGY
ncbi:hypothetical protein SAMN05216464_11861 [Mucilaginibacter pineti]|uniref:Uncharacterized protein n=1 Tax=Mucilaginibacter pineti TaxID=1391627 RepID=A0A1G7L7A9_9SPHI|nr:hypothetical protein [Mucilaginibacter pineti]SDF45256.1 hypothetical protein SAMN05216464_11861 [Mucilaginibacter pineti]